MAGTNDFQLFAVGGSANVLTQSAYAGRSELQNGVQSGQASSQLYNKHARQASIMASMIGQFIVNQTGGNAVDDGTTATLINQFIKAIQASTRIRLTGPTQFYVNPSSGSDNNSGLLLSSPFQTLQGAVNAIYRYYDLAGSVATINLANGNYVSASSGSPVLSLAGRPVGAGADVFTPIMIVGNPATPTSVSIQGTNYSAIVCQMGGGISISGVSLSSTGSGLGGCGMLAFDQGTIVVNGACNFGVCGGPQVSASGLGTISLNSSYTLSGSGGSHLSAVEQGRISVQGVTGTATGTPSFAVFANAESNSTIVAFGSSFVGSATGASYRAVTGGRILTGGNQTFFPGNVAGTVDSSSTYA